MARGQFTKPPLSLGGRNLKGTLKKSMWRSRHPQIWTFLCPLCHANRKVPFRSRPGGFRQISQIALTSIVFMICTWPWLGWKGIVSILPFWSVFEFVYRWRMRAALGCPHCGFDPYLFLIDEDWAKREVETHWRKKFSDHGIPYPEKAGSPGAALASTLAAVGTPAPKPADLAPAPKAGV